MSYTGRGNANEAFKATADGFEFGTVSSTATVGSGVGATYETVALAIAGGATRMNIIGETFEVGNLYTDNKLIIELQDGAVWDLGPYTLTSSSVVDVRGNGGIRYSQTAQFRPAFQAAVNIDGLAITNNSVDNCPLTAGTSYSVAACDFTGDLVVAGTGGLVTSCIVSNNIIVIPEAVNCSVANIIALGATIAESGTSTALTNIKL